MIAFYRIEIAVAGSPAFYADNRTFLATDFVNDFNEAQLNPPTPTPTPGPSVTRTPTPTATRQPTFTPTPIPNVTFTISPTSVVKGGRATATLTLTNPAPVDLLISLRSSNSTIASVPSSIIIRAGSRSASFSVSSSSSAIVGSKGTNVTITATGNLAGTPVSQSASLSVLP